MTTKVQTKTCSKCKETKPTSEFYANPRNRDGLQTYCKVCHKAASSKRQKENNAYSRKYYQENREVRLAYCQEYRDVHREEIRAKTRKRNIANTSYHRMHNALRRQKIRSFGELVDRAKVYARDNGRCGICGSPVDFDKMHLDHIVPLAKGGAHTYDNVQVAHAKCNLQKGAN